MADWFQLQTTLTNLTIGMMQKIFNLLDNACEQTLCVCFEYFKVGGLDHCRNPGSYELNQIN